MSLFNYIVKQDAVKCLEEHYATNDAPITPFDRIEALLSDCGFHRHLKTEAELAAGQTEEERRFNEEMSRMYFVQFLGQEAVMSGRELSCLHNQLTMLGYPPCLLVRDATDEEIKLHTEWKDLNNAWKAAKTFTPIKPEA
ncbi:MAG: hypothetical protein IKS71_00700 [Bacteroidales bacterium]|nr:hypothetical protein [Bacteroidales bacterium]